MGDLILMLRQEDAGIDRAVVRTTGGVRVASTTSIQTLLKSGRFHLMVNDEQYVVDPPTESMSLIEGEEVKAMSAEEVANMGDVRALVGQLYEALNVEEHQVRIELMAMEWSLLLI